MYSCAHLPARAWPPHLNPPTSCTQMDQPHLPLHVLGHPISILSSSSNQCLHASTPPAPRLQSTSLNAKLKERERKVAVLAEELEAARSNVAGLERAGRETQQRGVDLQARDCDCDCARNKSMIQCARHCFPDRCGLGVWWTCAGCVSGQLQGPAACSSVMAPSCTVDAGHTVSYVGWAWWVMEGDV